MNPFTFLVTATALTGLFTFGGTRAGFTNDAGFYVASCPLQSAAAIGLGGPRAITLANNPFGTYGMTAFGCPLN